MARAFNVVIERDAEGYYVGSVPELRGCHTQARSLDKLMERIQEAIELCLDVEDEETPPSEFIGMQRVWGDACMMGHGFARITRILHGVVCC
ncbi:MAG: type II toxin-antitoxin system HicB family antitoxin [Anaerolineae bacterium]|nr:type II toxin-antitoxin system HicB family antitoxin [Anaerolineae bacterium]